MILIFLVIRAVVNRFPRIMLCIGNLLTIFPFSFYCKTTLAWSLMGLKALNADTYGSFGQDINDKDIRVISCRALALYLLDIGAVRSVFTSIGVFFGYGFPGRYMSEEASERVSSG